MARYPIKQRFWRDAGLPWLEVRNVQDGRGVCYAPHTHETFSIQAFGLSHCIIAPFMAPGARNLIMARFCRAIFICLKEKLPSMRSGCKPRLSVMRHQTGIATS